MEDNSLAAEDGSLAAQKADSLAAQEADSLAAEKAHRLAVKRESLVQLEYSLAAGLCLIHLIQRG